MLLDKARCVSECLDAFMTSKLCKINFNIDYFKGAYISAILHRP